MSIKGFPSSQKLPLGTGFTNDFVTVQPSDEYRYSLDVNRFAFRVGSDTVPRTAGANTGTVDGLTWIYDLATPAKKGDFVRFEDGDAQYLEIAIVEAETNRFLIGANPANPPAAGDTFYILRSATQRVDDTGSQVVSVTQGPIQYVLNGTDTEVLRDTSVPANSKALPVNVLNSAGTLTDFATSAKQDTGNGSLSSIDGKLATLGQKAMTGSMPVTIASNQSGVPVDIEFAKGYYDSTNSTTTALGISGNFTGTWFETTNYAAIQVGVYSDQSSSSLGFKIEFSADGSTVAHTHYYTYESSANGTGYTFQPEFKYFRVNYTNDGVAQTTFTLYTALKPVSLFPSQYRVEQAVTGQSQALVTKGVIYGLTTGGGGGYVAVKVNPSGALTTDVSGTVAATQSGTWNITNISGTVSLPTNAASETTLADVRTSVQLIDNAVGTVGAGTAGTNSLLTGGVYNSSAPTLTTGQQAALQLDASGNLKTTATFTGSIGAVNQGTAAAVASAWPILVTDGTSTATVKAASTAATTSDLALVVALSPNTPSPATSGRNKVAQLYNDYTSTSVTTSAYTQLTASTASAVNKIEIFDSSGEALILAVGGAGSEVDQLYIFPGGNGPVDLAIPASSRISVKAKTATASAGFLAINLYS